MRAFAACLSVFLGLGAFSVVACSSDATTSTDTAGEAGETSSPAAGGGGASSTAEAGPCAYDTDACSSCISSKCSTQVQTCSTDDACGQALTALEGCACDTTKTLDDCETAFGQAGQDPAANLVTCFNDNCKSLCQ